MADQVEVNITPDSPPVETPQSNMIPAEAIGVSIGEVKAAQESQSAQLTAVSQQLEMVRADLQEVKKVQEVLVRLEALILSWDMSDSEVEETPASESIEEIEVTPIPEPQAETPSPRKKPHFLKKMLL